MTAYECDPDCDERADCESVGTLGHFMCGRCSVCNQPRHHYCLHVVNALASDA